MKYENAKDILPEELLEKVQKYAAGKLLYIPLDKEKRNWGEASGYREKLQKRNQMICNKYANGMTISELADEYFLSLDSIKKIIYTKNNKNLDYAATLESAVEYSNTGMIEEWIHSFLLFTCGASIKSEELMNEECIYFGIVKMPLRLIQAEDMTGFQSNCSITEIFAEDMVNTPPLIIQFEKGKFHVLVQKEMFTALKRRKVNAYPVFILVKGIDEYKVFMKYYGGVFLFVNKV